jgi:glycosyltransferase involved in cell wall biosynthesis
MAAMKTFAVIVPTRNRPHNIPPLIEAMKATMAIDTKLILSVDDDDWKLADYQALKLPDWVSLEVGPRMRLGPALNHHAVRIADQFDVIGFLGDDNRPRTIGWDWRICDEIQPGGIVYCNDLIQRWKLPTAVFLDSLIVRTLGYFSAPGVVHLYIDDAWKILGERLGRLRYLGDVVVEHCHPLVGTAEPDEGYAEVNSPDRWSTDGPAFDKWKAEQLDDDVTKMMAALEPASYIAYDAVGRKVFESH